MTPRTCQSSMLSTAEHSRNANIRAGELQNIQVQPDHSKFPDQRGLHSKTLCHRTSKQNKIKSVYAWSPETAGLFMALLYNKAFFMRLGFDCVFDIRRGRASIFTLAVLHHSSLEGMCVSFGPLSIVETARKHKAVFSFCPSINVESQAGKQGELLSTAAKPVVSAPGQVSGGTRPP